MAKRNTWNSYEQAALAELYFTMLDRAKTGRAYNKAAMIRNMQGEGLTLANRSRGSIEAKLMNASAAHKAIDPSAVTMDGYGYRALSNYQASLVTAMAQSMATRRDYREAATAYFSAQHASQSAAAIQEASHAICD